MVDLVVRERLTEVGLNVVVGPGEEEVAVSMILPWNPLMLVKLSVAVPEDVTIMGKTNWSALTPKSGIGTLTVTVAERVQHEPPVALVTLTVTVYAPVASVGAAVIVRFAWAELVVEVSETLVTFSGVDRLGFVGVGEAATVRVPVNLLSPFTVTVVDLDEPSAMPRVSGFAETVKSGNPMIVREIVVVWDTVTCAPP